MVEWQCVGVKAAVGDRHRADGSGERCKSLQKEGKTVTEFKVRIVRLEPMRVASALGFGQRPEEIAWSKILAFADLKGLLAASPSPRFFGFNNPNPSPGSPNYGYEQWITVGPEVVAEGEVCIKEIPDRLYAVARCDSLDEIGDVWKKLVMWFEESHYDKPAFFHQGLEELLVSPKLPYDQWVLDLFLPMAE